MNIQSNSSDLDPVAFARLPIFDAKKKLWGYELVYLSADREQTIGSKTGDVITADLMSATSLALEQIMDRDKKIMVNFSLANILDTLPYALPPGRTVVKITDPAVRSDSLVPELEKLKTMATRLQSPGLKIMRPISLFLPRLISSA